MDFTAGWLQRFLSFEVRRDYNSLWPVFSHREEFVIVSAETLKWESPG